MMFEEFVSMLGRHVSRRSSELDPLQIYLYDPRRSHCTDRFLIKNGDEAREVVTSLPFSKTEDWICETDTNTNSGVDDSYRCADPNECATKRQWNYGDRGICGNRNATVRGKLGIAKPRYHSGTETNTTRQCFLAVSEVLEKLPIPWHGGKCLYPFEGICTDDMQQLVLGLLPVGVRRPMDGIPHALRRARQTIDNPCSVHRDRQNAEKDRFYDTGTFSIIHSEKGVRDSLTFYSRRSVFDQERRELLHGPVSLFIEHVYRELIHPHRKEVDVHLLDPTTRPGLSNPYLGLRFIRWPCHMDPIGYQQVVLNCVLLMIDCFKLSFSESVGVVEVFLCSPECPVSFVIGVQIFLYYMSPKGRVSGTRFTHLLHILVADLDNSFRSGHQVTSPRKDSRYIIYGNKIRHSFEEWDERVMNTSRLALAAWMSWPSKPNEKTIKTIYNFFKKAMTKFQPNVDELGGQHGLSLYGHLGFFPSWFREYSAVNPSSRPMQFLSSRFSGKQRYPVMEATSVLNAVRSHLTSVFKHRFTAAHIENIICKAYRVRKTIRLETFVSGGEGQKDNEESSEDGSNGDATSANLLSQDTFCDLYLPDQHLFRQEENGEMRMFPPRATGGERLGDGGEGGWLPLGEYIFSKWRKMDSDKEEPILQFLADILPDVKSSLEAKVLNSRNLQQIDGINVPDLHVVVPPGIVPRMYITMEMKKFVNFMYGSNGSNGLPKLGLTKKVNY
jgi:hypothetical protein